MYLYILICKHVFLQLLLTEKGVGDTCTALGTTTECSDSNAMCTTETGGGTKCRCTANYYDRDLDSNNVGGTCTLSKIIDYISGLYSPQFYSPKLNLPDMVRTTKFYKQDIREINCFRKVSLRSARVITVKKVLLSFSNLIGLLNPYSYVICIQY